MTVVTIADITGDGAAHAISSDEIAAKWIEFRFVSGTGPARIGDSNVGSGQGTPVTATLPLTMRPIADSYDPYTLNTIYYFVPNSDKLSITYGI